MKKSYKVIIIFIILIIVMIMLSILIKITNHNKVGVSNEKFESFKLANVETEEQTEELSAPIATDKSGGSIDNKPEDVVGSAESNDLEYNKVKITFKFRDSMYYDSVIENVKSYIDAVEKSNGILIVNEYYTDADSLIIPIVDDGVELDIRVGLNSLAEKRDLMN